MNSTRASQIFLKQLMKGLVVEMKKQLKRIADELQLIRKEMQKKEKIEYTEVTAQLHEGEAIFSREDIANEVVEKIIKRFKDL